MTLTIDLDPETEASLEQEAEERGLNIEEYARELLKDAVRNMNEWKDRKPKNGAELVQYWRSLGVIGAWADRDDIGDTLEFARKLREDAQTRRREE